MKTLAVLLTLASLTFGQCLTTTFASNNGQSGNMFDLIATNDVTINTFDINCDPGTYSVEVYVVTAGGSYAGLHNTPAAWTLVGSASGVVSLGLNVPTPTGICLNVQMPATTPLVSSATWVNSPAINYTTGSTVPNGTVFAFDANLTMLAGSGHSYPFGSNFGGVGTTQSRIFNGNICYTPGLVTVPCPCPNVQINQAAASIDLDGNGGGSANAVATTTKCVNDLTFLNVNSNLPALTPWDLAIQGGAPLVPGLGTTNCQVINIDIGAGLPTYLSTGLQSLAPPFALPWGGAPLALPFLAPGPLTAHAQGVFINGASPDFFSLSAPVQLVTAAGTGTTNLTLADDNFLAIDPAAAPLCSPTSFTFYGTNYNTFFVNSNGGIGFTAGDTAWTPTAALFLSGGPRATACWTDYSPNLGGTVTLSSVPGGLSLAYSVPHFGAPAAVNTSTLTLDANGVTISGYAPDVTNLNASLIGISPGGGAVANAQSWSTLALTPGAYPGVNATDAVFEFAAGPVPTGWTSINFPNADGSSFIVN